MHGWLAESGGQPVAAHSGEPKVTANTTGCCKAADPRRAPWADVEDVEGYEDTRLDLYPESKMAPVVHDMGVSVSVLEQSHEEAVQVADADKKVEAREREAMATLDARCPSPRSARQCAMSAIAAGAAELGRRTKPSRKARRQAAKRPGELASTPTALAVHPAPAELKMQEKEMVDSISDAEPYEDEDARYPMAPCSDDSAKLPCTLLVQTGSDVGTLVVSRVLDMRLKGFHTVGYVKLLIGRKLHVPVDCITLRVAFESDHFSDPLEDGKRLSEVLDELCDTIFIVEVESFDLIDVMP